MRRIEIRLPNVSLDRAKMEHKPIEVAPGIRHCRDGFCNRYIIGWGIRRQHARNKAGVGPDIVQQ